MTDKVCGSCGTYIPEGKFCPKCGNDVVNDPDTRWGDDITAADAKRTCKRPRYDAWTGEAL